MVDFDKLNKDAKKMTYAIGPIVKLLRSEAISDGGTQKKAEALEGKWIRLNETRFAFVEESQITVIYIDEDSVGCACGRCNSGVMCEHAIAFDNLKSPPQLSIESPEFRWLQTYLFSLGWYAENRYVYPSLDSQESTKLDPVNEDKELDIGVDEEPAPKMIERKCDHCGFISKGYDRDDVVQRIAEHRKTCTKNPANKKKSARPTTQTVPEEKQETTDAKTATVEKQGQEPDVKESLTVEKQSKEEEKKVKPQSTKTGSLFDWVENLIEFGVGQIFGESGEGKTALCRELAVQAADAGKKVVYWDTEGNMTRKQRAAMTAHKNIEYILDRDWEEIRHMLPVTGEDDRTGPSIYTKTPKLKKCDLFILDSIGVPVLGIYGDLKQNEKGSALQGMQGLVYRLTTWAEKNEAVVIVTNQPVSAMNKTKEQIKDRPPFGDKMKYFTKEIMKMVVAKRTDYATVCNLLTWRTRDTKRGKVLATVTISDSGVEVTPIGGE
jgi:RecA/RadA recombinase